ncbi:hypothetical protein CHLRE_08g373355v5 [Chlamydomonas reinhardtii]|uniref:Uncharacterized protein n=1 Tax=Chlamydomonas reinhardtii TaxID=3055 RepID=A0A2K3DHE3_CHLRE|nr:uncharacterized protein CHLRE_08g373355v5 [Chlamydomonas reinhardtii]PNW79962.1 hypothetical protein CHLRE_08g373355v5 [Chlamydomonas reinhardtii]
MQYISKVVYSSGNAAVSARPSATAAGLLGGSGASKERREMRLAVVKQWATLPHVLLGAPTTPREPSGVVLDGNGLVESIVYEDKLAAKPLPEVTDSNGIGRALCSADLDPQPTDRLRVLDEMKRLSGDAIKLYSIAGLRVTAGNDMCRPRKPGETLVQAYATFARESPVWWADLERQLPWRMLDLTGQHAIIRATKAVGSTAEAAWVGAVGQVLPTDLTIVVLK